MASGGDRRRITTLPGVGRTKAISPDNSLYWRRASNWRPAMFSLWNFWSHGFAALLIALAAYAPASAQTPTFAVEGVVTDAQQAVLPGVAVTHRHVDRPDPRGHHRRGRPLCLPDLPPEGRYRCRPSWPDLPRGRAEPRVQRRSARVINFRCSSRPCRRRSPWPATLRSCRPRPPRCRPRSIASSSRRCR